VPKKTGGPDKRIDTHAARTRKPTTKGKERKGKKKEEKEEEEEKFNAPPRRF
jgi:hypothetical protein